MCLFILHTYFLTYHTYFLTYHIYNVSYRLIYIHTYLLTQTYLSTDLHTY